MWVWISRLDVYIDVQTRDWFNGEGCPTLQDFFNLMRLFSRMYTTHIKKKPKISADLLLSDRKHEYIRFEHKSEHKPAVGPCRLRLRRYYNLYYNLVSSDCFFFYAVGGPTLFE